MIPHTFIPRPLDPTACAHCGMIKEDRYHIPEQPPLETIRQLALAVLSGKRDYMNHQQAAQHVLAVIEELEEILAK